MKILFCNYEYPPLGGGGGVVMAALARELARRHEVTVITSGMADLPHESLEGGVRILRAPVFFRRALAVANLPSMLAYPPMAILRMLGSARRAGYDIVNTHFVVPSGPAGQFLSAYLRIPNVLSVHGGDLYDPSKKMSPHRHWWLRGPIRRMIGKADAVVGQSTDTVRHVADIYGVQRDVELIPLGIERPARPATTTRTALGIPENAFVMVTVGRIVPRKSSVQLVRALSASGIPNAYLVLIGDGPDAEVVRKTAAELGVADRVKLTGFLAEEKKHAVLAVADLFVSTSQHEGFGLVFLEAMAFGLPIICYDKGGQTDFLTTGQTGMVVTLNDLEAFTQAMRTLAVDKAGTAAMSAHNRRHVEHFFIDRCAKRYEATFERAVDARSRMGVEHS